MYSEKIFFYWSRKMFGNLGLKAENLQTFWDHKKNLFEQSKISPIVDTEYFLSFFLEVSQI